MAKLHRNASLYTVDGKHWEEQTLEIEILLLCVLYETSCFTADRECNVARIFTSIVYNRCSVIYTHVHIEWKIVENDIGCIQTSHRHTRVMYTFVTHKLTLAGIIRINKWDKSMLALSHKSKSWGESYFALILIQSMLWYYSILSV